MRDLSEVRIDIDRVDATIKEMYQKRLALSKEVAEYKIANNKPIYDKKREDEKINSLVADIEDTRIREGIIDLFYRLMADSRKLQEELVIEESKDTFGFEIVDGFERKDIRVVYQGEPGAYSQAAAGKFFGECNRLYNVATFKEAMEEVIAKNADYCVLPIENSTAGSVVEIYDLLSEYDLTIVGEQIIPIEHMLLAVAGADITDIRTVYSHPQALSQCRGFLGNHPNIVTEPMINTALAAKHVSESKDKTKAAIAGEINAKIYGLDIISPLINDEEGNSTRFIILTDKKIFLKDSEKISICFSLRHEKGSLYKALSHLASNGINLSLIESRPIKGVNWEYRFFIDIEGSISNAGICRALAGLMGVTSDFRILGNY